MNVGDYDQYCLIETSSVSGRNSKGEPILAWSTFTSGWFALNRKSGGESLMGEQITGFMADTFTGHYQDGVTQKMRLKNVTQGNRVYDIKNVAPLKGNMMIITAEIHD